MSWLQRKINFLKSAKSYYIQYWHDNRTIQFLPWYLDYRGKRFDENYAWHILQWSYYEVLLVRLRTLDSRIAFYQRKLRRFLAAKQKREFLSRFRP